jgi:hypothetical protein
MHRHKDAEQTAYPHAQPPRWRQLLLRSERLTSTSSKDGGVLLPKPTQAPTTLSIGGRAGSRFKTKSRLQSRTPFSP